MLSDSAKAKPIGQYIMFQFICFFKGKKTLILAETSYKAQLAAAVYFKAKKSYDITVMRADIEHSTNSI